MCESCLKVEQRIATAFVVAAIVVVVFGCLRGVYATWQALNAA